MEIDNRHNYPDTLSPVKTETVWEVYDVLTDEVLHTLTWEKAARSISHDINLYGVGPLLTHPREVNA